MTVRRAGDRRSSVWVLSELYHPEVTSTGHYMTMIAEWLASEGHDVRVLCGQPTYAARGTRAPRREQRAGVDIYRCRGTTFDKNRLLGRLANTITLSVSTLWAAGRRLRRGDVVIAVTNPPTMPWIGAVAARLRGARFVPLFHDVLPVVLEVAGRRRHGSAAVRLARRMTAFVVGQASKVVVVGRPLVGELASYDTPAEVVVIPNWADDRDVVPVDAGDSELRRELGLTTSRVVLYAGTFGRANDVATVVDAARRLEERGDIVVVLCGDGPQRRWVERTREEGGPKNLVVTGPYDRDRQSDMYGIGDVVVIPMLAGMGRSSMPSRAYNTLAAGRPIVAATEAESELAMLLEEHQAGIVVDPGDAAGLADAIERVMDGPDRRDMGRRARAAATGACSSEAAMRAWTVLVAGLLAPANQAL